MKISDTISISTKLIRFIIAIMAVFYLAGCGGGQKNLPDNTVNGGDKAPADYHDGQTGDGTGNSSGTEVEETTTGESTAEEETGEEAAAEEMPGDGSGSSEETVTEEDEPEVVPSYYSIGGTVENLEGTILVGNGEEELEISENGTFYFLGELEEGDEYSVGIIRQPNDMICTVGNSAGTVSAEDVENITIACLSSDTGISSISISQGVLSPVSMSDGLEYEVSFSPMDFVSSVTVTVSPSDEGASIEINGEEISSDTHSGEVSIGSGTSTIYIDVTASDGETTQRYTIYAYQQEPVDIETVYVKSPQTSSEAFGGAVALSGDTLAVGGPNKLRICTVNGITGWCSQSGVVYIYTRTGGVWSYSATINPPNPDQGDAFGRSVAIENNMLVVGVPEEDSASKGINGDEINNTSSRSGAVYVFEKSGSNWVKTAYLKASNAGTGDAFGSSVDISGGRIIVGSIYATYQNKIDGAAYIFEKVNGLWTEKAVLKASNAGDIEDYFGGSVAISGDIAVVGAYGEDSNIRGIVTDAADSRLLDNSSGNSGAVYIFKLTTGGVWTQEAVFKTSNADSGDYFGMSADISGNTVIVGAYGEDYSGTGDSPARMGRNSPWDFANNGNDYGAAYIFNRDNDGAWRESVYLKASNPEIGDNFGISVAIDGDIAVASAIGEDSASININGNELDNSASRSGAAYLFHFDGTSWNREAYVKASNSGAGDEFGLALTISGKTIVAGAVKEDSNARNIGGDGSNNSSSNSGAVYIYQ